MAGQALLDIRRDHEAERGARGQQHQHRHGRTQSERRREQIPDRQADGKAVQHDREGQAADYPVRTAMKPRARGFEASLGMKRERDAVQTGRDLGKSYRHSLAADTEEAREARKRLFGQRATG